MHHPFHLFNQNICEYVDTVFNQQQNRFVLESLVKKISSPANIKDTSLSYGMVNQLTLDNYGFSSSTDIIQKNLHYVSKKINQQWPKNYCDLLAEKETLILKTQVPLISMEEFPYVNAQGKVVMYCINKIPLLNQKKESIGLLTLAFDVIAYQDKNFLRKTYQQLYSNKKTALEKFLIHIGLKKYMELGITDRELDCLILRARGKSLKEIGAQLSLSPRTVESYLNQVREKFSYPNLDSLLDDFFCHYYH